MDINVIIIGLALLGGSFILSTILTAAVRAISTVMDFTAKPREDRYNKKTIALGGGIAISAAIVIFLAGAVIVSNLVVNKSFLCEYLSGKSYTLIESFHNRQSQLLTLIASIFCLHILGLIDDIRHLSPYLKLVIQFGAAFAAAYFGDIRVELFIYSKLITTVLSAIWIVLIINIFNFLDNMDGLSAGIAAIVSGLILICAASSGQIFVCGFAVIFLGTLIGFLNFNFPPATIFMGDAGSLVVGFIVAALSLKTTYYNQANSGQIYAIFMPLIILAVPLYDFASVMFLRIKQGKNPLVGDTQHFSHRLKRRGLTDVQIALTLYLATLCCGISALFLRQVNNIGASLVLVHTIMILALVGVLESWKSDDR